MIRIQVKLFAVLREMAGIGDLEISLSKGASCSEALASLKATFGFPDAVLERCLIALNGEYAHRDTCLSGGEELAILPPVSGG